MDEVILLRAGEAELWDAVAYYEEREAGLGLAFVSEVRRQLAAIGEDPLRPSIRPAGYRRVNLRRFPFYLAYVIKERAIWAHAKRKPGYWKKRIP
ncbi:MAG: type II toxin-antitoxin system RelE/ParE family toxin [Verrucomicrobiae bacterium]|nr:type II toxin-antitoxin system RelE/ParE family toxin [Verrucomicrobiae bacterium]